MYHKMFYTCPCFKHSVMMLSKIILELSYCHCVVYDLYLGSNYFNTEYLI